MSVLYPCQFPVVILYYSLQEVITGGTGHVGSLSIISYNCMRIYKYSKINSLI